MDDIRFERVTELLEEYGDREGTEAQLTFTTNLLRDLYEYAPVAVRDVFLRDADKLFEEVL